MRDLLGVRGSLPLCVPLLPTWPSSEQQSAHCITSTATEWTCWPVSLRCNTVHLDQLAHRTTCPRAWEAVTKRMQPLRIWTPAHWHALLLNKSWSWFQSQEETIKPTSSTSHLPSHLPPAGSIPSWFPAVNSWTTWNTNIWPMSAAMSHEVRLQHSGRMLIECRTFNCTPC